MNIKAFFIICFLSSNILNIDSIDTPRNSLSHYKNKIIQTIKADLGISDALFTGYESHSEQLAKELKCASRLFIYNIAFQNLVLRPLFSSIPGKLERQFNHSNMPSFFKVVFVAPLLEELLFTASAIDSSDIPDAFDLPGPQYRRWLIPVLFGLAHYHKDPKTYLHNVLATAAASFMHINHANRYWGRKVGISKVPFLHHMLNNFIGYFQLRRDLAREK